MAQTISSDNLANRGVKQDFPLRGTMGISSLRSNSGFFNPTKSIITHPNGIDILNSNIVAKTADLIEGYFYTSLPLTGNRTIQTPPATTIVRNLMSIFGAQNARGVRFSFAIDNFHANPGDIQLVGGAGVILQGLGFTVPNSEIALFSLYVNTLGDVVISRDDSGAGVIQTLEQVLSTGNSSGGNDIFMTSGDTIRGDELTLTSLADLTLNSPGLFEIVGGGGAQIANTDSTTPFNITSASAVNVLTNTGADIELSADGKLVLESAESASDAIFVETTDSAGGVEMTSGTGGFSYNTTGSISKSYGSTGTFSVDSNGTPIASFGSSITPTFNVNTSNLVFDDPTKGIASGPSNGVEAAGFVLVNGSVGTITDSGVVGPGSRAPITVTNTSVSPTSQVLIQVENGSTATNSAALTTSIIIGASGFRLEVYNNDGVATTNPPIYHYFVLNPTP